MTSTKAKVFHDAAKSSIVGQETVQWLHTTQLSKEMKETPPTHPIHPRRERERERDEDRGR